jgi:hypothetical protein
MVWSVLLKRVVNPVLMVVTHVLADKAPQVVFRISSVVVSITGRKPPLELKRDGLIRLNAYDQRIGAWRSNAAATKQRQRSIAELHNQF